MRTFTLLLLLPLIGACASGGVVTSSPSSRTAADSAAQRAIAGERAIGVVTADAVGIPPFRVSRQDSILVPLSYALSDMLTTDLSRTSRLQLVERARLSEVLRELQLTETGRVDSASAPRVGRLISARRLVLGSLDTLPGVGQIRLGVRLADVASGRVDRAIDARAPLNDILAAEKELAFRLFAELGITLTPAERATIAQRPTANLAALLAFGRGVRFQILGDYRAAAQEFRRAQQLDPNFREAGQRATVTMTLASAPAAPPTTPTTTAPVAAAAAPKAKATVVTPSLALPSPRATGPTLTSAVDRLNRPLDVITTVTRPSGSPADPGFPSSAATVILTVTRP